MDKKKPVRINVGFLISAVIIFAAGCDSTTQQASLHTAAQHGEINRVKAIVGSDPLAANLRETKYGTTPLHQAAGTGQKEVVRYLLSKGADPKATDFEGNTPLHYISLAPWIEIPKEVITLLVNGGANINARNKKGETPLHTAADYQNLRTMKLLIDAGANVNMQDNGGWTPLMSVMPFFMVRMKYEPPPRRYSWEEKMKRDIAIVDLLLASGTNPNLRSNDGETALHLVTYNVPEPWQVQVAEKLIQSGTAPKLKDKQGRTAADRSPPDLKKYLERVYQNK